MTFDLRRALRALACGAGALLALVVRWRPATGPASAATASEDRLRRRHRATCTFRRPRSWRSSRARPGEPYDPKVVQDDLARINALGYFADIAPPLVRQRPNGIAITYRVVENPVSPRSSSPETRRCRAIRCLALMDLSVGQVFNTNTFRQDVLKINNYYERIGYGGQVPTHVKDLNLDPKIRRADVGRSKRASSSSSIIIGGDPLLAAAADSAVAHAEARLDLLRRGARRRL